MRRKYYDNNPVDLGMSVVLPPTNSNPPMPKVKKPIEKFSYGELRDEIQKILCDFLEVELECNKGGEFDFEWMEHKTDDILRLIMHQGGSTG